MRHPTVCGMRSSLSSLMKFGSASYMGPYFSGTHVCVCGWRAARARKDSAFQSMAQSQLSLRLSLQRGMCVAPELKFNNNVGLGGDLSGHGCTYRSVCKLDPG